MPAIEEMWEQVAVHIGEQVRAVVNTPETIGSDHETGYVLMFFNMKHHNGKATVISSAPTKADLKKILKYTLRHIDGPKGKIIEPPKFAN